MTDSLSDFRAELEEGMQPEAPEGGAASKAPAPKQEPQQLPDWAQSLGAYRKWKGWDDTHGAMTAQWAEEAQKGLAGAQERLVQAQNALEHPDAPGTPEALQATIRKARNDHAHAQEFQDAVSQHEAARLSGAVTDEGFDTNVALQMGANTDWNRVRRSIAETPKAGARGLFENVASGISGTGSAMQGLGDEQQAFLRQQISVIDKVAAGQPISATEDTVGYREMDPAGLAAIRKQIEDELNSSRPPGTWLKEKGQATKEVGDRLEQYIQKELPIDPDVENQFLVRSARMAGGFIPYMVVGSLAGVPGVMALAGSQSYESTFQQAKQKGASDEDAHRAAAISALTNAGLMAVPISRWMEGLPELFKDSMLRATTALAKEGIILTSVMQSQKLLDNIIAKTYFDPDRKLSEGLGEEIPEQLLVGTLFPAGMHGVTQFPSWLRQRSADRKATKEAEALDKKLNAPDVDRVQELQNEIKAEQEVAGKFSTDTSEEGQRQYQASLDRLKATQEELARETPQQAEAGGRPSSSEEPRETPDELGTRIVQRSEEEPHPESQEAHDIDWAAAQKTPEVEAKLKEFFEEHGYNWDLTPEDVRAIAREAVRDPSLPIEDLYDNHFVAKGAHEIAQRFRPATGPASPRVAGTEGPAGDTGGARGNREEAQGARDTGARSGGAQPAGGGERAGGKRAPAPAAGQPERAAGAEPTRGVPAREAGTGSERERAAADRTEQFSRDVRNRLREETDPALRPDWASWLLLRGASIEEANAVIQKGLDEGWLSNDNEDGLARRGDSLSQELTPSEEAQRFRDLIKSPAPLPEIADRLGVSKERLAELVDDGVREGSLRRVVPSEGGGPLSNQPPLEPRHLIPMEWDHVRRIARERTGGDMQKAFDIYAKESALTPDDLLSIRAAFAKDITPFAKDVTPYPVQRVSDEERERLYDQGRDDARDFVTSLGQARDREFGAVVLPDGTVKGIKDHPNNSRSVLTVNEETAPDLYTGAPRSVDGHHNHPDSKSFSRADYVEAAKRPAQRRTYVHGHDGSEYWAYIKADANAMGRAYDIARGLTNVISAPDFPRYRDHMIALMLKEAGLIDYHADIKAEEADKRIAAFRKKLGAGGAWQKTILSLLRLRRKADVSDRPTRPAGPAERVEGAPEGTAKPGSEPARGEGGAERGEPLAEGRREEDGGVLQEEREEAEEQWNNELGHEISMLPSMEADWRRIGEKQPSGFYFLAGRKLLEAPSTLFPQGGQAVINWLRKNGVKRAEINHFQLQEKFGDKATQGGASSEPTPVTRGEMAQAIADRMFDFRLKYSKLNPERPPRAYPPDYQVNVRAVHGPRIPGQGIYDEKLYAFPKQLEGGERFAPGYFISPHWKEQFKHAWASLRGTLRDIPNWGKSYVNEETQSDFMQGAVTVGRHGIIRPRIPSEEYLDLLDKNPQYQKLSRRFNDLQTKLNEILDNVEDDAAALKKAGAYAEKIEALKAENPEFFAEGAFQRFARPERSFTPETALDESYVRHLARAVLLHAVKLDADAVMIPTSETTDRIQLNTFGSASHFYDQQLRPSLQSELRRITGDNRVYLQEVPLPKAIGGPKREKPYTVRAARLSPELKAKIKAEGLPMFSVRASPEEQARVQSEMRAASNAVAAKLDRRSPVDLHPISRRVRVALRNEPKVLPQEVREMVVSSIVPHEDGESFTITAIDLDGNNHSWLDTADNIKGTQALFDTSLGGRPVIAFHAFDTSGDFVQRLRTQRAHEGVHALRELGYLPGASLDVSTPWGRLVSHANSLGVLKRDLKAHLELIGHPFALDAEPGVSLEKVYHKLYGKQPDYYHEAMDQEAVTHLTELYVNAGLPEQEFAPVKDLLDAIISGDMAKASPPGDRASSASMFSATGPGMGYAQRRQLDRLGFFHKAEEEIKNWPQERGTPDQVLAYLKSRQVKDAEIKATSLDKFLNAEEGRAPGAKAKTVSRQEILDFLNKNRVEVRESMYGGKGAGLNMQEGANLEDFLTPDEIARMRAAQPQGTAGPIKWHPYSIDPDNPTRRQFVLHLPSRPRFDEAMMKQAAADLREGRITYDDYDRRLADSTDNFTDPHFPDEPNPIVNLDTSIQKMPDGSSAYNADRFQMPQAQAVRDAQRNAYADKLFGAPIRARDAELTRQNNLGGARVPLNFTIAYRDLTKEQKKSVSDAISSARKKGESIEGVRDEGKIAELNKREAEAYAKAQAIIGEMHAFADKHAPETPDTDAALEKIASGHGYPADISEQSRLLTMRYRDAMATHDLIKAERQTAERAAPSHPMVDTTDAAMNFGIKRLVRLAAEAGTDHIAITPAKVLMDRQEGSNNPEGMTHFQDVMFPRALGKYLASFDPSIKMESSPLQSSLDGRTFRSKLDRDDAARDVLDRAGGNHEEAIANLRRKIASEPHPRAREELEKLIARLEASEPIQFHTFPLTDKVKQAVMEGQPLFAKMELHPSVDQSIKSTLTKDAIEHDERFIHENYNADRRDIERRIRERYESKEQLDRVIRDEQAKNRRREFQVIPGDKASAIPRAKISTEEQASLSRAMEDAIGIVGRIAGKDVKVVFRPTIGVGNELRPSVEAQAKAMGTEAPKTVAGFYRPATVRADALIGLATNDPQYSLRTAAGHEAWHHVEEALATPQELKLLNSPREMERLRARAAEEVGLEPNDPRLASLPKEEVRALAFQNYLMERDAGMAPASTHSAIRKFWDRILQIFQSVRNALGGRGYEDIFESARTGEMAERGPGPAQQERTQEAYQSMLGRAREGETFENRQQAEPAPFTMAMAAAKRDRALDDSINKVADRLGIDLFGTVRPGRAKPTERNQRADPQRDRVLKIANEGGQALINKLGTHLTDLARQHGDEIRKYAMPHAEEPVADSIVHFFNDFVARPEDAKAQAPEFYRALGDLLDGHDPQMLRGIEAIQTAGIAKQKARAARLETNLAQGAATARSDAAVATEGATPPPAAGMVRMYHGGAPGEDPNMKLWFTSDKRYAEGWAARNPRHMRMWYVDVPENHPLITPEYENQGIKQGFTVSKELPPEIARNRRVLNEGTPTASPPAAAGGGQGGWTSPPAPPGSRGGPPPQPPGIPPPPAGGVAGRGALRKFLDGYKRTFQPELFSEQAMWADALTAEYASARQNEKDVILDKSEALYQEWRNYSLPDRMDYIKRVELQQQQPTQRLGDMAFRHRRMLNMAYRMEALYGSKAGYLEAYFPHIWKDQDAVRDFFKARVATMGPRWFQKLRSFDLVEEGLQNGFELKSANPEELVVLRLLAGVDMRQRMEWLQSVERLGLARRVKDPDVEGLPRLGWTEVNAPNMEQWLLAPDVFHLWKNGVDAKGLWTNQTWVGSTFRGMMHLKNVWVPLKLAISGFHPLHVVHIGQAAGFARAYTQLAEGHDVLGALKTGLQALNPIGATIGSVVGFATAGPAGVPIGAYAGSMLGSAKLSYMGRKSPYRAAWLKSEGERTEEEQRNVTLMKEGGFVPAMSEELRIQAKRVIEKAWDESKYLKLLPHGLRRAIELIQKPLFENWIPHLKAHHYMMDAAALFDRRPDLLYDDIQRKVALRAIAKSNDNRFGQMFYGGLFWNRVLKDAGIASMLSLGWNAGFVREFGGGFVLNPLTRNPISRRLITRTATQDTIEAATNKTAFSIIYMATAAMTMGMITYANTGEQPQGWDYVFPRIGGLNPDGTPRRITNMSYLREIPMWIKHWQNAGGDTAAMATGTAEMIWNKMVLQPFAELWNNRDYWGYQLWSDSNDLVKQSWQFGKQLFSGEFGKAAETASKTTPAQIAKHIVSDQLSPITVSGSGRAAELSGKPYTPWGLDMTQWPQRFGERAQSILPEKYGGTRGVGLSMLGFGPAPAYAEKSATENHINHLFDLFVRPYAKPAEQKEIDEERRRIRTQMQLAKQGQAAAPVNSAGVKLYSSPYAEFQFKKLGQVAPSAQRSVLERMTPGTPEYDRYMAIANWRVRNQLQSGAAAR